jgi:hypothetical protein
MKPMELRAMAMTTARCRRRGLGTILLRPHEPPRSASFGRRQRVGWLAGRKPGRFAGKGSHLRSGHSQGADQLVGGRKMRARLGLAGANHRKVDRAAGVQGASVLPIPSLDQVSLNIVTLACEGIGSIPAWTRLLDSPAGTPTRPDSNRPTESRMISIRASWRALAIALIAGVVLALPGAANAGPPGKPDRPVLSVHDAVAYEGEGRLSFPITLDRPAPRALQIIAVPLGNTARPFKDYRPGAVSTTIQAGAIEGSLEVRIRDNEAVGPDAILTLRIAAAPGAAVAKGRATGTIRDDDPLTSTCCTSTITTPTCSRPATR